mgnify:CR=1 FL=1
MSKSEVLTREIMADTLQDITKNQEATIESCVSMLNNIKDSKKVTEANLRNLINVFRELDALREQFFNKLLNSAKRGNMLLG